MEAMNEVRDPKRRGQERVFVNALTGTVEIGIIQDINPLSEAIDFFFSFTLIVSCQ